MAGFRETKRVRVFPDGWDREAARFRAAVVAARVEELFVFGRGWQGLWEPPSRAVVAFTFEDSETLEEVGRDALWNAFGVPVFEQYLDAGNALLAAECEAHRGLHVQREGVRRSGWRTENGRCACGSDTPRLLPAAATALTLVARA